MVNYLELVENAEDGKESPFKAMAVLRELKHDIEECIKQLQPIVVEEASKYEKTFEKDGFKIEKRNGRKIWNFKKVAEWSTYDKAKSDCEDRLKTAYAAYQQGNMVADAEGEVVELPEVTYAADVVVIKNTGESLIH